MSANTPASHKLIVFSDETETIFVLSGEKATRPTAPCVSLSFLSFKEFMNWLGCAYGWDGDSAGWNLLGV